MERSLQMVAGLLGILKAGGVYVPLDSLYPKERLAFTMEDTQIVVLLTQRVLIENLPKCKAKVICLDSDWDLIEQECDENLICNVSAGNLAYINYTSGSTGQPKGVEVLHRGIARLLFGIDYVQLNSDQTFLQMATISFDASTFELWGALLHGARCVLFPEQIPTSKDLSNVIKKHRISSLWLTGSLFNAVIDEAPETLLGISQLLIGGEALSVTHVRRALELLPNTQIINGYGPTESTTFTCCYPIPKKISNAIRSIPIGRPIGNTEVYLLDSCLQPVPIGTHGELYIGGDGLARGYLNGTELTAEKFFPNPFSDKSGARLYKTGDLARYLADGNIEFLGRIDHQVKIRGFRVELGEIEIVLGRHPAVQETVVLAREDKRGDKRLTAYVVPEGRHSPTTGELRAFLKEKLPDYMVPSYFAMLDMFPLTPNGKVDRGSLPTPDTARPKIEEIFVAPRTPLQRAIAKTWAQVLGLERVGVHDNFFELGGHSLLATRIMSRLSEAFKIELPLRSLFEAPNVAELARDIGQRKIEQTDGRILAQTLAELNQLSEDEVQRLLASEMGSMEQGYK